MRTIIIAVHLMIVIALVVVVLLQRSEGGALGIGSSSGGFLTGRGQANALTRATAILGGLFFLTSIVLTLEANLERPRGSIIAPAGAPSAPGPAGAPPAAPSGGLLNQLQQIQQQRGAQGGAPAAPGSAPTSPAPAPAAPGGNP